MNFSTNFLKETTQIAEKLNPDIFEAIADELNQLKKRNGRLFLLDQVEALDMQACC